ncbi:hypothetical protein Naga_101256g3 [Nannochloropsis gaditana]|uniref:Uncharacterized protein n=1 Tax=Nannochloropsis gaditana TaxID=72520 RepID=W7TGV2_9STRA|nr:hypothetical protein Naga_101256g3 [Nannochloropsis gaditana]
MYLSRSVWNNMNTDVNEEFVTILGQAVSQCAGSRSGLSTGREQRSKGSESQSGTTSTMENRIHLTSCTFIFGYPLDLVRARVITGSQGRAVAQSFDHGGGHSIM